MELTGRTMMPQKNDLNARITISSSLSCELNNPHSVSLAAPPISTDLNDLIENRISKFKDNNFVYLTYAVARSSKYFTPYHLLEVPFAKIDRRNFFTISRHGVTVWRSNEMYFTPLEEWRTDYLRYCDLVKINFFRQFRLRKSFVLWRNTIKWNKFRSVSDFLEKNLVILNSSLASAIMQLRKDFCRLLNYHFINVFVIENWELTSFFDTQMITYETTKNELEHFHGATLKILYDACIRAIKMQGFSPQDEALLCTTRKQMNEMMSFAERARKRRFCALLARFLTLCDHIITDLLHRIISNSFRRLSSIFVTHDSLAPKSEMLEGDTLDREIEDGRPTLQPQSPFINCELVLETEHIAFSPSRDATLDVFKRLDNFISGAVHEFKQFQTDVAFKLFTEPVIMGRQEERLCNRPPNLDTILNADREFLENKESIYRLINKGYDMAAVYVKRFEAIRINYAVDLATDPERIRTETDLFVLRGYCERYTNAMVVLECIPLHIKLGLLQLKQNTFKDRIAPVCGNLINVINVHLPALAIERVNDVTEKASDIHGKLIMDPEDVASYVVYLRYLDDCRNNIAELVTDLTYTTQVFDLMNEFNVHVEMAERNKYNECTTLLAELESHLKQKINEKHQLLEQLSKLIALDVEKLFDEVRMVGDDIVQPWLIDINSDLTKVVDTLTVSMERLVACQQAAQELKKYQKEFKIEVTRFDELDTVLQKVRVRQNLWENHDQSTKLMQSWYSSKFTELNIEEMSSFNAKTLKNCSLCEKNLPPNEIVTNLRANAEIMKHKIPIIAHMRNPALKIRHWLQIEQILDLKLVKNEQLTLTVLEEANIFDEATSELITEVAGQASAEAGLDVLLRKVEDAWKALELTVVAHRDSRDVFILAGIDELQTVLDESNISINTVAASRHVGHIKARVTEWFRILDLVTQILDEALQCQQSWLYLEAIFSAPDIQRQLPNEARMFLVVDKSWKDLMRNVNKMPLALPTLTDETVLATMKRNNELLAIITRCLEAYLEVKRVAFPRFYFLSNDELLEILAQTRNPHAVQPHLRKCFDAIAKLDFVVKENADGSTVMTTDIDAIISPEGERVLLGKGLKARGPVEDWLAKVEYAMFVALKRCMKFAYRCYANKERTDWFREHANQIVLTVSQQQWGQQVHSILDESREDIVRANMKAFEQKLFVDLAELAAIARTDISKLLRKILCALITIDVHNKDTISNLVKLKIVKANDFNWLKMLRYYWRPTDETMEARMASGKLPYFYEYLGAGGVLVITPLTDRCYLCLMGALQMDLGGAPAGPAGTGKTETTKDLAKALAKQCVVFNCSEGLDYKMMGRFFSGLAQSGAWCCFDEFNRIDIEVLSVIAQQLITIRNAKVLRQKRFQFEGREIKLDMSCAAFITMNPGYAGRTELPDNLKALFRPISMMVPDYALIAEVILYSEGFEASKMLAQKMVQMYKLCSEQLSQQDHYDFGMRAVKSVLVMAGTLKRAAPDQREEITLIAALRDANLPKFLADDALLFKGILGDLFPTVQLPMTECGELHAAIEHCMKSNNFQPVPEMIVKNIQLYETMCVRWGVMLVGPTGGGKTSVIHTLANALTKLWEDQVNGPNYRRVRLQTLNPKAVSLDELYGAVNLSTMEWRDGLLGLAVRSAVSNELEEHEWVICDGPVDAVWIENMNTVLDDNKMLCLANSERIKLTPWVHMLFEVQDLAQASPATVSRCGMVYIDPREMGWLPLVQSWQQTMPAKILSAELMTCVFNLFRAYFNDLLEFAKRKCIFTVHQVDVSKVAMTCSLIKALAKECHGINGLSKEVAERLLCKIFIWSSLWAIGGNLHDNSRSTLETEMRILLKKNELAELRGLCNSISSKLFIYRNKYCFRRLPDDTVWNNRVDLTTHRWQNWSDTVPAFVFDPNVRFFDMLVQTSDTTRFGYVAELLFKGQCPVMFTGDTGVGKSVLAKAALTKLAEGDVIPVFLNFSAQTSSQRTQEMIEARLDRRKKTLLGAPIGKVLIMFVDDVNMPKLDVYGSQPPIELLRQFIDFKGVYDREKMYWKDIEDVVLGAACGPPGGGRNALTPRFTRHFALLQLPQPSNQSLITIFSSIVNGFFGEFGGAVRPMALPIVNVVVEIYGRISQELLPTPAKSHYVFNLRDLSKCIQGVLQANSSSYVTGLQVQRLFYHEAMRVFHDRLTNDGDKYHFKRIMEECCVRHFETDIVKNDEIVLFGDFMIVGQNREDRIYEEIKEKDKLRSVLTDYLEDYSSTTGKEMKLILFDDAVEHIIRLARLLRAERGNGLLVGLSGMGKQSLSRLAAHINGYGCAQIELRRGYDHAAFHEDLRKVYLQAGVLNKPVVFLITDTQIIKEEFLEDINNILNSGEVPNLFEGDDYENVILNVTNACVDSQSKDTSRDGIYQFFIARVRANLHVIICMSPIGDAFRRRCRMFPSLVNCCTIDWFVNWPPEALHSVAIGLLSGIAENDEQCQHLAEVCVLMHKSVEKTSEQFHDEMRRHYYTTPSSYLEMLKLYRSLLKKRTEIITAKRRRIENGLNKILETNEVVLVMQVELQNMQPLLEEQSNSMQQLLTRLDEDTKIADTVRKTVTEDEAAAKDKKVINQEIADDAAKDLEIAMPALRAAENALKALNKNDINELRVFQSPPKMVVFVMEAVCILLDAKPDWQSAKVIMSDVNFLKRLVEFDTNNIPEKVLQKLKPYVTNIDFNPAKIEKVSKVAKSMCLWVRAIDEYAKVYKIVEPKVRRHKAADAELKEVMALLKQKQKELATVEAKLQSLMDSIEEKNYEFSIIQNNVDLANARLNRAGRLTSALVDEEVRWTESIQTLGNELRSIPGDVLVASAYIAYLGAFSINYRKPLVNVWIDKCRALNIPSSLEFNLIAILGDAYEIRNWNMHGLPRDEVSIENGLIVTKSERFPLMIDPQEQANLWIRSMEKDNELKITKMSDSSLMRTLETCIRQGYPMLVEEIDEQLDPALDPILGRQTFTHGGRLLIKLGDSNIDYDVNFRLYMTTKLSNPHYLPEVCIKVTLVNFLVTKTGLEDQLLADVVAIELPELEQQRSDLIVRINADRQQLLVLEDKVLRLLFSSQGNILDDEELVETLNEAKETSAVIADRLEDTESTEIVITASREKYRPLAARGAVLYFVVAALADIDPMYQYSLKYFKKLFRGVIELEHPKMSFEQRLNSLMADEIHSLFVNVSRGLFEKHKLIYSFLLAVAVTKQLEQMSDSQFEFLIRGPIGTRADTKHQPDEIMLSRYQWKCVSHLEYAFPIFKGLTDDLKSCSILVELDGYGMILNQSVAPVSRKWSEKLSSFEKLMLVKSLRDERMVIAIGCYVRATLGQLFTEVPKNSGMSDLFSDTSNITPLVFVLSTGSDPMENLVRFAIKSNWLDKLHSISLGQGQGPAAEGLIQRGRTLGHWIFLQNCHLATSWMPAMETIVRDISLGVFSAHPDFRLFLSSMPTKSFPISVLQNSVKVTNEPPKGLRANLTRALGDINEVYFDQHAHGSNWRTLVFGLCLFHGIVLERRKFGPLGWNITYEFNESDRECGLRMLDLFCDRANESTPIPWDALEYINGEITWGGRVTDYWDQRCLRAILKVFIGPHVLSPGYSYSASGVYRNLTNAKLKEFRSYVHQLPIHDDPEIFGMHENANIVFETNETQFFVATILEGQPRVSGSGGGAAASDDLCLGMIDQISGVLAKNINVDTPHASLIRLDDRGRMPPLTTVLMQEIDRFDRLLKVVHSSLTDLERAIKGFLVMSDSLEAIFNAFLCNQVPHAWAAKGFLSTKTLAYWVADLQQRIDFVQNWFEKGPPRSTWISGLFFPQSFLTGTLQMHSRLHKLPIDELKIDFQVMRPVIDQADVFAAHKTGINEGAALYRELDNPATGVYIHGLFIEGGRWNLNEGGLCDSNLGELLPPLPVVWLKPCLQIDRGDRYEAPLYKTQVRAGVLSTTGHSTNFVLGILLESKKPSDFWILRGTALVTLITE